MAAGSVALDLISPPPGVSPLSPRHIWSILLHATTLATCSLHSPSTSASVSESVAVSTDDVSPPLAPPNHRALRPDSVRVSGASDGLREGDLEGVRSSLMAVFAGGESSAANVVSGMVGREGGNLRLLAFTLGCRRPLAPRDLGSGVLSWGRGLAQIPSPS